MDVQEEQEVLLAYVLPMVAAGGVRELGVKREQKERQYSAKPMGAAAVANTLGAQGALKAGRTTALAMAEVGGAAMKGAAVPLEGNLVCA